MSNLTIHASLPREGIVYGMPEDEYHNGPEISKTGLWTLHSKTPFHYRYGERKETQPLEFGRAAHCSILEPDYFGDRYAWGPDDRRGKKWVERREQAGLEGKTLLTSSDWQRCIQMRDAVYKQLPLIRKLIQRGTDNEVSLYWDDEETGERCRSRIDVVSGPSRVLADLKTAGDASPFSWSRSVQTYGYHVQSAMYRAGWFAVTGEHMPFFFIVVEKEPPYACALYEIEPVASEIGERIFRQALNRYHECKVNNEWPAWGFGINASALPRWAYTSDEWAGVSDEAKGMIQ